MRVAGVLPIAISWLCSSAMAMADPCMMRVTDMNVGTYRGEEIQLLGEIWLHCKHNTSFQIDLSRTPTASDAPIGGNQNKFNYKLTVSENSGVRVEERYDLIRIYGQTGEDREVTIPFLLMVPGGLDVVAGEYDSTFRVELRTH